MSHYGLTDSPIKNSADESLGLLDYVEALSDFIRNCDTPMTIAIQGDWGTGKTSMMNLIRDQLSRPEEQIETRWFNTWMFAQFQAQDEIPLSLLAAFLDAIGRGEARQLLGKFSKVAKGLSVDVAKTLMDVTTGGGSDLLEKVLDRASSVDNASTLRQLKDDIAKEVKALLEKKRAKRLVVFIDDLDRLIPERAVEILEIVKIFLDVEQCVFVLAVDYHVVSKGLEQKFGVSTADLKGKSFFDKIIQMPFNLPVAQYDTRRYISQLFGSQFHFAEQDTDLLIRLAETSVGSNPRSLKRLFNTLQLLKMVADKKKMLDNDSMASREERERILFAVLCLQLSYEPIYKMLLRDMDQLDTNYFDTFTDPDKLKADQDKHAAIVKHVGEAEQQAEAIHRFTEFMGFLVEACRLQNSQPQSANIGDEDTEEDTETFNETERDLLLRFLSLSSLTSASAGSTTIQEGTFRHKAFMLDMLEKTLKPKYQAALMAMGRDANFIPKFHERCAEIGFDFPLAGFSFWLGLVWDDDKRNIRVSLWDNGGGYKKLVREWFSAQCKQQLPNLIFHDLRRNEFANIDLKAFPDAMDAPEEQRYLEHLRDMAVKSFDVIIPQLLTLYQCKQPDIDKLNQFTDRLTDSLKQAFPASGGWEVNRVLPLLNAGPQITLTHSQWKKICVWLGAEFPFLERMFLGVLTPKNRKDYAPDQRQRAQDALRALAIGDLQSNDYWVGRTYLQPPLKNLGPGRAFLGGDWRFPLATQAEEDQARDGILALFARFRNLQSLIAQLAASEKTT